MVCNLISLFYYKGLNWICENLINESFDRKYSMIVKFVCFKDIIVMGNG